MSKSDQNQEREEYLEERNLLIDAERESARSFDKSMITLSAGALGLSITIIRHVAPTPQVVMLLYFAWGGFIFALLCTLTSFLLSQSALRRQREILDLDYEGGKPARDQKNCQAAITNCLNWLSIISFIVGVICFVLFGIKNLSQ